MSLCCVLRFIYYYTECHNECCYAKFHHAECNYARCCDTECHYAECRGAPKTCQAFILLNM